MTITQLGGHKFTARGKDPSLQFDLNTTAGDANIKSVSVTLPKAFEIDQEHLGNLCSKAQLENEHCAGRQPIGTVIDETPLLEHPLEGSAYAVTGLGGGVLPHVVFILGGQVTVMPEGESKTVNGGELKTDDPDRPRRADRPLPPHPLRRQAGLSGEHPEPLRAPIVSSVQLNGQNGKTLTQQVKAKTACKAKKKPHRAKRHRARR